MLELVLGLALLAVGFWAGRKSVKAAPPAAEAQEVQRLQEDKAAFDLLMGYNAQRAYGGGDLE